MKIYNYIKESEGPFLGQNMEKEMKSGFPDGRIVVVREPSDGEGKIMVELVLEVRNLESLISIRSAISTKLSTDIALFHDEYKQLTKNISAHRKL